MQINYEEEARRKQQEQEQQKYQTQRDPFKYGQEVARRRYSEIMSGLQNQKQDVSRSYSDMYQAAKQQAVAQRAAGAPSLSGGMKAQYSDLLSTREIGAIGQIGAAQNKALRDIQQQEQSAFANAQLEGIQAEQMQLQSQQTQLGLIQQKNQIMSDKNLTKEQKAEQLNVLGYTEDAQNVLNTEEGDSGVFAGIASIVGGTWAALKFSGATKAITTALAGGKAGWLVTAGVGLKIIAITAALAAVAYGVERVAESSGVRGGQGFVDWAVLGMK